MGGGGRLGLPDAGHDEGPDQAEGDDAGHPDPGVRGRMAGGGDTVPAVGLQDPAQPEPGQAAADVLHAVQRPGHRGRRLAAAEVHGRGAREHAVDPEDEHGRQAQQHDRPELAEPGAAAQAEAQERQHDHLHQVEDEGHRRAAGLEQGVAHPAAQEAAEDPAQHEGHSGPPEEHFGLRQVIDLGQVFGEVEHHALAHEAGAELGRDQEDDDRVAEHLGQQLLQDQRLVLGEVGVGAVAGVEVGVPGVAGPVAHEEQVDEEHREHGRGRARTR